MKIKESEEKMKNSFKFNQNNFNQNDFNQNDESVVELPTGEIVEIIGDGTHKTPNIPKNHTIANKNVKKRVRTPKQPPSSKKNTVLGGEVGIGSNGFTSMITLASIIVIAGIIIAYIIFKV